MIDTQLQRELLQEVAVLPVEKQRQVLDYVRAISALRPPGTPGKDLMKFIGVISPEDCDRMLQAIEENCEQVDADGW